MQEIYNNNNVHYLAGGFQQTVEDYDDIFLLETT
jgi:hypothetical protein